MTLKSSALEPLEWWQFEGGFPTPEEWQAFWAGMAAVAGLVTVGISFLTLLTALGAVWYARRQLRELVSSNRELEASNIELSRSKVSVRLDFYRQELADHRASFISGLNLIVENVGRSPAVDIHLLFQPVPSAHPLPPMVREILSGSRRIATLMPRQQIVYRLEDFPQGTRYEPEDLAHHNYEVAVGYIDKASRRSFGDHFSLSIEPLLFARQSPDPLARIAKDLQALTQSVASVARALQYRR